MADTQPVQPRTQITEYTVFALPLDLCVDAYIWQVKVEWRGGDRWAVTWGGRCLSDKGTWDWESLPYGDRKYEWLATHRFSEADALQRAEQAVTILEMNNLTPADLLAKYANKTDD